MVNIRDSLTLKACRIIVGLKVDEIATAAGVTVDTVYKWEKCKSFPTAPQMVKIIELFAEKGYIVDMSDIKFF